MPWWIVPGLLVALAAGLLWLVYAMQRKAVATGAALEAGKVSQATATTEAAVAQAEASAPTTKQEVAARLRIGKF